MYSRIITCRYKRSLIYFKIYETLRNSECALTLIHNLQILLFSTWHTKCSANLDTLHLFYEVRYYLFINCTVYVHKYAFKLQLQIRLLFASTYFKDGPSSEKKSCHEHFYIYKMLLNLGTLKEKCEKKLIKFLYCIFRV